MNIFKYLLLSGALFFSLTTFAVPAAHKVKPLTFAEFKSLPDELKISYLRAVHYVLRETAKWQDSQGMQFAQLDNFDVFKSLVMERAYAEDQRNCFYAGWVFQYHKETKKCQFSDKPELAKLCKGKYPIPCNPLIFGTQPNSDAPHCTVTGNDATRKCLESFEKTGDYKSIVTNLDLYPEGAKWDRLNKRVGEKEARGEKIELWTPVETAIDSFCPPKAPPGSAVRKQQEEVCKFLGKMEGYIHAGFEGDSKQKPPVVPPPIRPSLNPGWDKLREIMTNACGHTFSMGICPQETYNPPMIEELSPDEMARLEEWSRNQNIKTLQNNQKVTKNDAPRDLFLKYFGVSYDEAKLTLCGDGDFNDRIREVRLVQTQTLGYLGQNFNAESNIRQSRLAHKMDGAVVEDYLLKMTNDRRTKLSQAYDKFYQCSLESYFQFEAGDDIIIRCDLETLRPEDEKKGGLFKNPDIKNRDLTSQVQHDIDKEKGIHPFRVMRYTNSMGGYSKNFKTETYPIYSTSKKIAEPHDLGEGEQNFIEYWDGPKNKMDGVNGNNVVEYQRFNCPVKASGTQKAEAKKKIKHVGPPGKSRPVVR